MAAFLAEHIKITQNVPEQQQQQKNPKPLKFSACTQKVCIKHLKIVRNLEKNCFLLIGK